MYAIVDIAGKQFKVSKGDKINVPRLDGEQGSDITFDKILLISDKGKVSVGQPVLTGAIVKATIEDFGREKKIIIFKKKRRKGYQVTRGHRQDFTTVTIKNISQSAKKKSGDKEDGA